MPKRCHWLREPLSRVQRCDSLDNEGILTMRKARLMTVAAAGLALVAIAGSETPTADIQLLTHDARDPAPQRFKAAIDLGLVGVSVLYTWTVNRIR